MSKAYCFDLDGTITREEILPAIAFDADLHEEISALTLATIRGVIPFRKSFLLRCRLLADVSIPRVHEIVERIPLHSEIVDFIRHNRDTCYVITGNLDCWIEPLASRLGCRVFASSGEVDGAHLRGVSAVLDKGAAIADVRGRHDWIVVVGDGMGDVPMFQLADRAVAFGGTHEPLETLVEYASHITYDEKALCRLLSTL